MSQHDVPRRGPSRGGSTLSVVPSETRRFLAIVASVAVGAMVTLQSKINGELGDRLGDGPRAGVLGAVVSFGTGLLLLSVLLLLLPAWRRDLGRLRIAVRERRLRGWQLLGGLAGATLVASQTVTVSSIGVALFIVAVVAGQTSSALAVDHAGLSPSGKAPVTAPRVVGALLAIVAVAVSSSGLLSTPAGGALLLLALFPLLAGGLTSVQQAVNAHVAQASSPWVATWNNFVVGTTALVIAFGVTLLLPGRIDGLPGEWWLYLGGVIGVLFIATGALVVRVVGVLMFGLASVSGQVLSAIVLDLVTAPEQVTTATYAGAALTLVGVSVAAFGGRVARRRAARRDRANTPS